MFQAGAKENGRRFCPPGFGDGGMRLAVRARLVCAPLSSFCSCAVDGGTREGAGVAAVDIEIVRDLRRQGAEFTDGLGVANALLEGTSERTIHGVFPSLDIGGLTSDSEYIAPNAAPHNCRLGKVVMRLLQCGRCRLATVSSGLPMLNELKT
jgi:hypothetical protein